MKYSMITSAIFAVAYAAAKPIALQSCAPLQYSDVPEPSPNTVDNFGSFAFYDEVSEVIRTPSGYKRVVTGAHASVRSDKYMSYVALDTYDVSACAQQCNSSNGCDSFNIYFQRSPSVAPDVDCPNPSARTLVLCGLYNEPVVSNDVMNAGQSRGPEDDNGDAFQIIIRGSNVYNKVAGSRPTSQKGLVTIIRTIYSTTLTTVTVTAKPTTSTSMAKFFIPDIAKPELATKPISSVTETAAEAPSTSVNLDILLNPNTLPSVTRFE